MAENFIENINIVASKIEETNGNLPDYAIEAVEYAYKWATSPHNVEPDPINRPGEFSAFSNAIDASNSAAHSEAQATKSETEANRSEDRANHSYERSMISEAEAMTSDSYANEPHNQNVKEYYYDQNSDSIEFNELIGVYSALHYATEAEQFDPNDFFLKTEHINSSTGSADANKPIVLNGSGLIDASMLDTSTFYPVAPHDPSDGIEYPDTTGHTHGAFWWVETLANPDGTDPTHGDYYEFKTDPAASIEGGQIASLLGKRIYIGDFMVWAATGWGIMAGEMNPLLYYKLDGTQAITGPFAGGGQQIKNIADGSDATDAVTMEQLNTKVNKSGDTMTGSLNTTKIRLRDPYPYLDYIDTEDNTTNAYIRTVANGDTYGIQIRDIDTDAILSSPFAIDLTNGTVMAQLKLDANGMHYSDIFTLTAPLIVDSDEIYLNMPDGSHSNIYFKDKVSGLDLAHIRCFSESHYNAGVLELMARNADGTPSNPVKILRSGNVETGTAPTETDHLTNKAYVDNNFLNLSGGELTGALTATTSLVSKQDGEDANAHFEFRRVDGSTAGLLFLQGSDDNIILRRYDTDGSTILTSFSLTTDGNVIVSGDAPTGDNQLTRKDYVDGMLLTNANGARNAIWLSDGYDIDTLTNSGFYGVTAPTGTLPDDADPASNYYIHVYQGENANNIMQKLYYHSGPVGDSVEWTRNRSQSSDWRAWRITDGRDKVDNTRVSEKEIPTFQGFKADGFHENIYNDGIADANDILWNSIYNISAVNVTNLPSEITSWCFLHTMVHANGTGYAIQMCYNMNSASNETMFYRRRVSDVWSGWYRFSNDDELANTYVAKTGSTMTGELHLRESDPAIRFFGEGYDPTGIANWFMQFGGGGNFNIDYKDPDGNVTEVMDFGVNGAVTFQNTVQGMESPIADAHLTRKDYVDAGDGALEARIKLLEKALQNAGINIPEE